MPVGRGAAPVGPAGFLLAAARAAIGGDGAGLGERAAAVDQWPAVLDLAGRLEVRPLLHAALALLPPDAVPAEVQDALQGFMFNNAARNLFVGRRLLTLLDNLTEAGVPAVPFKGAALAQWAYGNLAAREFSDIDLLAPPEQAELARRVLLETGYHDVFPRVTGGLRNRVYKLSQVHYDLISDDGLVPVDLQWRLAPGWYGVPLPSERWWQRLQMVTLLGQPVPVFGAEDLVVYLCLHGGKHNWREFKQVCDLAQVIARAPELDWDRVGGEAADAGAGRMLRVGLRLAHRLLRTEVPAAVRRSIATDAAALALADEAALAMFGTPPAPFYAGEWYALRLLDSPRQRAWYCAQKAVTQLLRRPLLGGWVEQDDRPRPAPTDASARTTGRA